MILKMIPRKVSFLSCCIFLVYFLIEKAFKDTIIRNMPDFKNFTDMSSLLPYLYKYQLITPDEHMTLLQQGDQSVYFYSQMLPRKGVKAHVTFYKCLNEAVRDTHSNVGHHTLLKFFNTE